MLNKIISSFIVLLGLSINSFAIRKNPACIPMQRNDWSVDLCKNLTKRAKAENIKMMFIGDSIIQLWSFSKNNKYPGGLDTWNNKLEPLGAVNFGVAGDLTENVLWRITEGKQLDGNPQMIVILVGTNNLHRKGRPDSPEMVAEGIDSILKTIREISPQSKILLLGLFPRGFKATSSFRKIIPEVNKLLEKFADNKTIFFIDFGNLFLSEDGTISKELLRDGLHLSPKGYQIWADNMNPYLLDILNNDGKGDIWIKK